MTARETRGAAFGRRLVDLYWPAWVRIRDRMAVLAATARAQETMHRCHGGTGRPDTLEHAWLRVRLSAYRIVWSGRVEISAAVTVVTAVTAVAIVIWGQQS